MEGRKLQLVGGSTYQISLPRLWVESRGLKPRDTLGVEAREDGSVAVRADWGAGPSPRRKVFELSDQDPGTHLLWRLLGAYVANFDIIEIRGSRTKAAATSRIVRDFCRLVNGPEIVEETSTLVVIQDLSEGVNLDPRKCLRRMQLAVQAMLADALRNLRERDPRVVEEVASRGEDIERLFWMVAKVTDPVVTAQRARNSAVRSTDGQPHGAVAKLLKRMSGQVVRLAEGLLVIRPNDPKETKLLADLEATGTAIAQILDKACEAVQNTDVELATEAIESRERLEETLNALPRRLSHHRPSDALHVTIVAESLHRTADCAAEIAEHAVDLALSQT